eukprot:scaffold421_cov86-Skeletonema_menzelii.AAC.1
MSYSCPSIGFINPRTLGFVHSSLVSTESRSKVLIANKNAETDTIIHPLVPRKEHLTRHTSSLGTLRAAQQRR